MDPITQAGVEIATSTLMKRAPIAFELARDFKSHGKRLALVGGSVRDAILGRLGNDLDFTTDAHPDLTKRILSKRLEHLWDTGARFGTISGRGVGFLIEITTYRSESYQQDSRKPAVEFGKTIDVDLSRRDFTINAMALELTSDAPVFIDPYHGVVDLAKKLIRTPLTPEISFSDDPLRMLRAIRFAAQLGFAIGEDVSTAIAAMRGRLEIISAERIREEFTKIILSDQPRIGIELLVESGLAEIFIPEVPKLQLEVDEHHHHKDVYQHSLKVLEQAIALEDRLGGPNLVIRLAALLHDIGKPKTKRLIDGGGVSFYHHEVVGAKMTRERLKALRFDADLIKEVSHLVFLHLRFHGYGNGEWTDSAVRRYVRDAGNLLEHLHVLTRADCTTRNRAKADSLAKSYDSLEERITKLAQKEELSKIRPELDGEEIMRILGIKPGPVVGKAYEHLLELRIEEGPLGKERAEEELLNWWRLNGNT
ncbi:MAG: CCA tRNA nucleotidyltransferase [Actinobacteria bacterium]|nr:CCA tRNA nucleotidyltransferase [Actinomycetota bacterium]